MTDPKVLAKRLREWLERELADSERSEKALRVGGGRLTKSARKMRIEQERGVTATLKDTLTKLKELESEGK